MRSKETAGGHSNQCAYNAALGKIETDYPEAGSADYWAVNTSKGSHYDHDVAPFNLAWWLDKISDYYSVRPVR